jgi:hypothetical protein
MSKEIKGLDKTIKTISNMDIAMSEGVMLTYKDAIVTLCEMVKSQVPGETLKAYAIGMKVFSAKDSVVLTEEEFTLLNKLINESKVFIATVIGRLVELLESAEDISDK